MTSATHPKANLGSSTQSRTQRFVFLGANTPWVYALAESLSFAGYAVLAAAPYDLLTYRQGKPRWPARQMPSSLRREFWIYPPGYAGIFAPVFAPLLFSRLARSLPSEQNQDASFPWTISPYPWFARTLRRVPANRLIYYNLDDYVLYQPSRAESTLRQEAELVERAALTLCLSRSRTESLRSRFPKRAESILHFPLGAVADLLNPSPGKVREGPPVVGYVGHLIERVDWQLVVEVARQMTDVEFHFLGSLHAFVGGGARPNWRRDRDAALALPNVRHLKPVRQEEVAPYYWDFNVSWIPYDLGHAFNQSSCPTKIMDGLASGKPLLSADVPECRLYPEFISIFKSVDEAVLLIRQALQSSSIQKSEKQVDFVRQHHLWSRRAEWLAEHLP